jgi:hypothetical protein
MRSRFEEELVNASLEEYFPRFTFEDSEHVCLIATYVAAGHGEEINLLPDQRQSWSLRRARSLNGDVEEAVNAIFWMLQHVLMAQRKHDFKKKYPTPLASKHLTSVIGISPALLCFICRGS